MRTIFQAFAVVVAAALCTACYESPEVTMHSPGEYKGSADPLTQRDAETRADDLADRFELVQVDR